MSESVIDISTALNDAANASLEGLLPEEVLPTIEPDLDVLAEEAVPVSESPEVPAPEPVDAPLPSGYVAIPAIGADAVSTFALYDSTGEIEAPALQVEYKANGKMRVDRLDQVVKLAQMGVYNYERDAAREQDTSDRIAEMQSVIDTRESQLQQLLDNEDVYLAARDRYAEANTPEMRANALAKENAAMRAERVAETDSATARHFYSNEVLPALRVLTEALPEVSEEELSSYLTASAMPLLRGGIVPPQHYDTMRQYIVEELTPLAQRLNNVRRSKIEAASGKAQKQVAAAQVSAQKAKREVGKILKPGARGMTTSSHEAKKPKPHSSVDDAVESAMSYVLAELR
jgi:hypothetical protein